MEKNTGRKIKVLCSDNSREYTSDPFLQLCRDEGIERYFTVRETPQQSGVAKRMNMTLLEKVCCMLFNAGLSKSFWAKALAYTFHPINSLPSSAIRGKTLLEVWSRKVAQDYDSLRIFGCPAYYHVKKDKLGPRVRKSVLMGFQKYVKSYKICNPKDKKIILSRDVIFDENSMVKSTDSQQAESEKTNMISQKV